MKDKQEKKLTFKQFMSRWKEGINGITKKQQIKMQIQSMYIVLLGMSIGIFIMIFNIKTMWWVELILIGGYYNVSISIIGLVQQFNMIKKFENLTFETEEKEVIKNV